MLKSKFGPYAEQISAVWFWNKLKLRGGSRRKGGEERLAYFRGGFVALAEALARRIRELGGRIVLNTPFEKTANWVSTYLSQSNFQKMSMSIARIDSEKKNALSRAEIITFYSGLLILSAGFFVFLLRVISGLNLFYFTDESEKFVAAQLIHQGSHLYGDIFAHHGPIPYTIAHLYTLLVSQSDFSYIRVSQGLLAIVSCLALILSPIFKSAAAKAWIVGSYLLLLSSVWVLQSIHMILYQSVGGFFLTVPFAQLFLPLFFDERPYKFGLFASGAAVTLACFTAYTFGPSCLLLISAAWVMIVTNYNKTERWALIKPFLFGVLLTALVITAWLVIFADLKGFFIYHFYFNQQVYSAFINFSFAEILNIFYFSLAPNKIFHAVALSFFVFWIHIFLASAIKSHSVKSFLVKSIALALAVAAASFTNPRGGDGSHDSAFVIVGFALFALSTGWLLQCSRTNFYGAIVSILIFIAAISFTEYLSGYAISTPHGIAKKDFRNMMVEIRPEQSKLYDLIRSLTKKEGDFLSLIYNPIVYIKADRRPASGHYYYLPWQAKYNKNPIGNHKIDICDDIRSRQPAVIWFDDWKVWDYFTIEEYEPCVPDLIKTNYNSLDLLGGAPWFIRNDLLPIDEATINRFEKEAQ